MYSRKLLFLRWRLSQRVNSFVCHHLEGHILAKRLSKQITKATKVLKSSIQDYNNLECSNSCSMQLKIMFDAVKDPDCDVWMEVHASGESATAVPASIRRKAIDLNHSTNHCQEEISLLQSEMENTLEHFIQQHQLLLSTLGDGADNDLFDGRGRDIFIRGKLLSLESYCASLLSSTCKINSSLHFGGCKTGRVCKTFLKSRNACS